MPEVFLPVAISLFMLLGSMLSYGIAMDLMLQFAVRLTRTGAGGISLRRNVAVMTFTLLATAAAHFVQIASWAVVFISVGEMSTLDRALYLSAQNYTALGYGDVTLSAEWELLGPLEAFNGLLLFGLSTAVMFAVMSRLVTDRLRFKLRLPLPGRQGAGVASVAGASNSDSTASPTALAP